MAANPAKPKNQEKKWPIYPTQLITDREGCSYCGLGGDFYNIEKCACCGIMSENLALGNLYSLYIDIRLPMILYEHMDCPRQEGNPVLADKLPPTGEFRIVDGAYYAYEGQFYHSVACEQAYRDHKTHCYSARRDNLETDNECIKRDLGRVRKVYADCQQYGLDAFLKHPVKVVNGKPDFLYYQVVSCDDAVSLGCASPRDELMIPLFADWPEEGETLELLAVLFVGQLAPEGVTDKRRETMPDGRVIEDSDETVAEVLKDHAEVLWEFITRMRSRTYNRRMEFLFAKQAQLQKRFEELGDDKQVKDHIITFFKEICEDFDLKRCLLYLPDLSGDKSIQTMYEAMECTQPPREETGTRVYLERLPRTTLNGWLEAEPAGVFEGIDWNDAYDVFVYRNQENTGLALLLEWKRMTREPRKRHKDFFNAILAICYSHIMARVTEIKQENIWRFAESTRHDLSQRLAILEMHNNGYNKLLRQFARLSKEYDSRIQWTQGEMDRQEQMQDVYQASLDYRKDMIGLYNSLQFLRRTLDAPEMRDIKRSASFQPYSRFLFNMREQYNSLTVIENRGKFLRLLSPNFSDPYLIADATMVERVVSNLLHNAFKYAYNGTYIYLECYYELETNSYVFKVTNFGAGIRVERAEDIFKWGVQEVGGKGGGYGLDIARKYADMHDGSVELECGRIGVDPPETEMHFPALIVAEVLSETNPDWQWPEQVASEKRKLQRISSKNPVAQSVGLDSLYDEIFNKDAREYFRRHKPTPAWFRVKRPPTYRVTFAARIPMQNIAEEEKNT